MVRHAQIRSRARPLRLTALVLLGLTLTSSVAFADESEGERLFREGRARMLDGRFDEACPMLEQSQKLEPHVGTLLNVAACHERQGKVGSAWVEYQKALTAARAEGQVEREKLAAQRIGVLEPRVPWLRVSSALDDVVLTLDGGELARAAWGQEMPVDPGVHVVVAERGGVKVFEERVDLRESERRNVRVIAETVPPLPEANKPERIVVEPKPTPPPPQPDPAVKPKGRWVLSPGVFVGYLGGTASHPRLDTEGSVSLMSTTPGQRDSSCASNGCDVGPIRRGGSAAVGLQVFAGYAASDAVDVGLRVIAAPALSGGSVWAFGPAVVLHPTESVSLGLFGLFGDATFKGDAIVTPPSGYNLSSQGAAAASGVLAGGFGLGAELSVRMLDLGRGAVYAQTTPFFLGGNGNAFCIPVGFAYRFQ